MVCEDAHQAPGMAPTMYGTLGMIVRPSQTCNAAQTMRPTYPAQGGRGAQAFPAAVGSVVMFTHTLISSRHLQPTAFGLSNAGTCLVFPPGSDSGASNSTYQNCKSLTASVIAFSRLNFSIVAARNVELLDVSQQIPYSAREVQPFSGQACHIFTLSCLLSVGLRYKHPGAVITHKMCWLLSNCVAEDSIKAESIIDSDST